MADGDPVVHLSPNGGMSSMCGVRSSFCWISGVDKAIETGVACPACLQALRPPPMPRLLVLVMIVPMPMAAPPAPPEPERRNVIDVKEV